MGSILLKLIAFTLPLQTSPGAPKLCIGCNITCTPKWLPLISTTVLLAVSSLSLQMPHSQTPMLPLLMLHLPVHPPLMAPLTAPPSNAAILSDAASLSGQVWCGVR